MKTRPVIPIAIICLLLLAGVSLEVSRTAPAAAQSGKVDSVAMYTSEQGAVSGGSYRLTSLTWQACGTVSSGGGYNLTGPMAPASHVGSGCCCTYLPGILVEWGK